MGDQWEKQKALAEMASLQGNLAEAETMWLSALEQTGDFESTDPRLFATVEQLSMVAEKRFKWQPCDETGGLKPAPGTLSALATKIIDLIDFYYSRHRYTKAELLCKRLLSIYERAMAPNHPDVGTIVQNLGNIYKQLGRPEMAEQCTKRATEIRSQAIQSQLSATKQKIKAVKIQAAGTCNVCGRPLLGSARPISGERCLRCTSVAMHSINLRRQILQGN